MKKTGPSRRGFEPQIFEQVPAQNLNFEGDQINRAHGSLKISTLLTYFSAFTNVVISRL